MIRFNEQGDGFCGLLSQIPNDNSKIIIVAEDQVPDSFLVKAFMKWLNKLGVSSMGIGPEKSMKGLYNWPLENVENAVRYLKNAGYKRIGICGISSGSNMALSAAARIPDITLTIALTPMDWVYWGYLHDKLDGATERPAEGKSAYSWRGEPVPYMHAPWNHPDYCHKIKEEAKQRGDLVAGLDFHHLAEEKQPLTEEVMIPIEKIQGILLLAGAEDDVVWDTCRGIQRMQKRLDEKEHGCQCKVLVYQHCSHFIFPESLARQIVPSFAVDFILPRAFKETKEYVKECRESRRDLDDHIQKIIRDWAAD